MNFASQMRFSLLPTILTLSGILYDCDFYASNAENKTSLFELFFYQGWANNDIDLLFESSLEMYFGMFHKYSSEGSLVLTGDFYSTCNDSYVEIFGNRRLINWKNMDRSNMTVQGNFMLNKSSTFTAGMMIGPYCNVSGDNVTLSVYLKTEENHSSTDWRGLILIFSIILILVIAFIFMIVCAMLGKDYFTYCFPRGYHLVQGS